MNIATYSREKNLGELAKRIFHLPAKTSAAQLKRAEDALLRANPGLQHLKDWTEGAPILVPGIAGLQATNALTLFDVASELVTEEAARGLEQLRKSLAGAAGQNLAEVETVLNLLKSKAVKASAARLAEVKTRVTEISATTKTRQAEFKTAPAELGKVLADVAHGIKKEI